MIARLNSVDGLLPDPKTSANLMSSLLAFDTATEHMSVALSVGDTCWTHEGAGGAQASTTLIPACRKLLSDAGIRLSDLDAICFGQGPGAFTGLRTACSVAQGLALGADKPVICIDTLQTVAEDARHLAGVTDVWVVMDARMNEIYAARYRHAGNWTAVDAPALHTLESINARLMSTGSSGTVAVAGTAIAAFGSALATGDATCIGAALPRAAALIAVARARWDAGDVVDAALALPLYLRDKVALTTLERAAVKAAKVAATAQTGAARAAGALAGDAPRP